MILKAKHHLLLYPFFEWYGHSILKKDFGTHSIEGELNDRHLPLLLLSNHISWWDGFWGSEVNIRLLHRKFHAMMQEDQLRKHWYFNYSGCFSVCPGAKSVVESLRYTVEILKDAQNMVLLFPQGEIQSMNDPDITFEKGVAWILNHLETEIQVVFLVNLVDYFSDRKPGLYSYIREYTGESSLSSLQEEYRLFYSQSVEKQKKRIG
ncbi:MAG TPA: 1-acyl-sn-glycerol-3-phosphate acyltransferase [Prolixibacteraceae bacterium]|nr:1-acyl-sn-glycerol-3-phosphate acyltransferase [Prolixibacteraceae bacterium]